MREDLPDPETPVTAIKRPSGKETEIFLRLLCEACSISSARSVGFCLILGIAIERFPLRYAPVTDSGSESSSLCVPLTRILPPFYSGAWSKIHHPVCCPDRLLIMFHHNHRIAHIAQLLQRGDQLGCRADASRWRAHPAHR